MTRGPVPSSESVGVEQVLHDDALARVLVNTPKDANAVSKALADAGIPFASQQQHDDVVAQIGKIDWSQLQKLEGLLGRTDTGTSHPRMG
jgi:hypothetical protein